MPSEKRKIRKFHCADCRQVFRGWAAIVRHTVAAHGRKPYVDKNGAYPDSKTAKTAQMIAAMNDGLMIAC